MRVFITLPKRVTELRRLFMKKNKLLVLGLIAMMLIGGLALASCGRSGCEGAGTCEVELKGTLDYKGSSCSDTDCAVSKDLLKAIQEGKTSGKFKCDC
jgi:hypothetical protein